VTAEREGDVEKGRRKRRCRHCDESGWRGCCDGNGLNSLDGFVLVVMVRNEGSMGTCGCRTVVLRTLLACRRIGADVLAMTARCG